MEELVMRELAETLMGYVAGASVSVSVCIVFLLLVRPFMKKLPRIYMYVLWGMLLVRILSPLTIHGIYGILPEPVEQLAAQTGQGFKGTALFRDMGFPERELYGGVENQFRLPETLRQGLQQRWQESGVSADGGMQWSREKGVSGEMGATAGGETENGGEEEHDRKAENGREGTLPSGPARESGTGSVTGTGAAPESADGMDVPVWMFALWAAGVCLCLGYELVSMLRMRWRFRDAKQLSGNIFTHPLAYGSFVAGIIVPKIYVPEQLGGREWDYVVRHEQVHIRRRDYLVKPLVFSVFSLFWFNPFVWTAYHFMMRDMEISCDENVIRNLPAEERKDYSYLLLAMTGGAGVSGQSPAFSAGEVRERIMNVSKYKKPGRFVSVLAAVSVVLCGCGIVSSPEQTTVKDLPQEEGPALYVEQAYACDVSQDIQVKGYSAEMNDVVLTPEGEMMTLLELYEKPEQINYKYGKAVYEGGAWTLKEEPWIEKWNEETAGKNYGIEAYEYGADGNLYVQCSEESIPHTKLWSDREKYMKDFYIVHLHMFRINEEKNEITEIPLPEETYREIYGKEEGEDVLKGVARYDFSIFDDGNILLWTYKGNLNGIYSSVTGEKLVDIQMPDISGMIDTPVAGDGFFAFSVWNQESGMVEIRVVGEDGKPVNTITTHIRLNPDGEEGVPRIGVRENTIMLAYRDGIFEAEPGSSSLTHVVDGEKDNLYYLTMDGYSVMNFTGADDEGDYVLLLCNDGASSVASDTDMMKLCRYTNSRAEVIK